MSETVEATLGNLACQICRIVGLDPADVGELRITPKVLEAKVYKRTGGRKYLKDGKPAVEIHTYAITVEPIVVEVETVPIRNVLADG